MGPAYRSGRFERVIAAEKPLNMKTQTCRDGTITESYKSHALGDQGQAGSQGSGERNKSCHVFMLYLLLTRSSSLRCPAMNLSKRVFFSADVATYFPMRAWQRWQCWAGLQVHSIYL